MCFPRKELKNVFQGGSDQWSIVSRVAEKLSVMRTEILIMLTSKHLKLCLSHSKCSNIIGYMENIMENIY